MIKSLGDTLEKFKHPERYPEGYKFRDPAGEKWIKFQDTWVNQAYIDTIA